MCGVTKINKFTRAAHLSLNSYIRSNKILNIVILLVYVDTNHMYKYFGKCILFLIKPMSLTIILPNFALNDQSFQCSWPLLGLDTPNGFQCSWPLLGLDTPNSFQCSWPLLGLYTPNGFHCSWPLLGLDTPNEIF